MSYEGHRFLENVPNLMQILKMEEKKSEKAFCYEIIASELVALNCLY